MNFLSIVIPFFKYADRLNVLLESLFKSYNNCSIKNKIQIIIVNDYPEFKIDKSILNNHDTENQPNIIVELITNNENLGVSKSRNIGRKKANGKFLTFIDQDDFVSINYFEVLFLTLNDDHDLYILNTNHIWEENNLSIPIFYIKPEFNLYHIIRSNFILTPGMIIYRNKFLTKEFICYDNYYTGSDDWALYLEILNTSKPKVKFIGKRIFNYITHQWNESSDQVKLIGSNLHTISKFQTKRHKFVIDAKIFLLNKELTILSNIQKGIKRKIIYNLYYLYLHKFFILSINNLLYIFFKKYKILSKCLVKR